jgi:hypothetical protein
MNNVDLAIQQLRQLQQKLYDTNVSINEVNKFLESSVFPQMDKASTEIKTNYQEISDKLTAQLNTGKPQ